MNIFKQTLPKSQIELTIELSADEFRPYILRGAENVSREVKIEGFRPGKVPYEVLKNKIGEMTILEEAARLAINKTIDQAMAENIKEEVAGQPQVNITKLAPDNPLEYKVVLAVLPEIKLGDYKSAKVKMEKMEIRDEEVLKTIEYLSEAQAKEVIVDRAIKDGDKAVVDIEMFLDNVPVEGGQGKGAAVIIGKDFVVPGFDKNLINAKKNDVRDFKLPYPEDHHMKNLAGKMVDFKVKIIEVYERQLPALDDHFSHSFGLKNFDGLKENIKKSMGEEKKVKAEQKAEIEIMDKIIEKTKFSDIPETLIKHEAETMMFELKADIERQGGKLEDYLMSAKKTREQAILDFMPAAVKRVKSALAIREISKVEKIEVSEKEIEEKIEELLKQYKGYEKVESRIKEHGYRGYLKNILTNRKVVEKLREWNVENK
jgi:trigger factor